MDSRYVGYFPEYCNYFVKILILKNSMYGMNNSGKRFSDELTNFMINVSGFKKPQFKLSIHYKYVPDVSKLVVLSYVEDCVVWYDKEDLGKWFVDKLRKRFNVNFLGHVHWFMPIRISQIKGYSISLD